MRAHLQLCFTCVLLLSGSAGFAQLSYRGEIDVATGTAVTAANDDRPGSANLRLRAHVELDYDIAPMAVRVVLDRLVALTGPEASDALLVPGLTEAYARYALPTLDLSAGLERLPLETARLSVPFRLEPIDAAGQPLGLLGVRANVFLEDWRIRPALLYRQQDDQLGGILSVRRDFGGYEIEAHALYLDGLRLGLGGSGLIDDVVVYGEAWLLAGPWSARGALGMSGYLGDALWTAEAAFVPDPGPVVGAPIPQLLGQINLPQGDAGNLRLGIGVGLVNDGSRAVRAVGTDGSAHGASSVGTVEGAGGALSVRTDASVEYNVTKGDHQWTTGLVFRDRGRATHYGLRLAVTAFF